MSRAAQLEQLADRFNEGREERVAQEAAEADARRCAATSERGHRCVLDKTHGHTMHYGVLPAGQRADRKSGLTLWMSW